MGSSSTLIVGGIACAKYFLDNIMSNQEMINLASIIEGPDNVAPAILGGFVASFKTNDGYKSIKYKVNDKLKFITITPPYKLSTEEARKVLPDSYQRKDVVSNLARIINLPYALGIGDISLLKELFIDKIHEPYRLLLIKNAKEIKEDLKDYDCTFSISGGGSTMLLITTNEKVIDVIKKYNYCIRVLAVANGYLIREI